MQQVGVDQHRQHAQGLVVLDEAHAAHVGGQIINVLSAGGGLDAVLAQVQIEDEVLHVVKNLIPLVERFDIHGADPGISLAAEIGDQSPSDKAPASSHYNQLIFHMVNSLKRAVFVALTS